MSKKIKLAFGVILLIFILIFAGYYFRIDRFGLTRTSWVDFVKVDNTLYYAPFNRALVDKSKIKNQIGEVKFNVSKKVHSSHYKIRNYDASYLEVGTEIYTYETGLNAVAVKIGNNYFEYVDDLYE